MGHALAQAALFEKILFQPAELLVNQVIGLMNQADGNVGDGFRRAGFHEFAVKLVGLRHFASEPADILCFFGIFVPHFQVAGAEIVFVVIQQFLQAGPPHIGELDLGFLGGERGLAAFQEILFTGTGGLNHLVHSAVAPGEMLVRKAEGQVIDHLGFVEGMEGLIIATRGDDGMGIRGEMGCFFSTTHMLRIIPIVFHGSFTNPEQQCALEIY